MLFRKKFWGEQPKSKAIVDADGVVISDIDERGAEVLDSTPIAPPIGYQARGKTMMEIVREMVISEKLAQDAANAGYETFEESEDFDVDDDYDPSTPYENDFDPTIPELRAAVEEDKKGRGAKAPPVAPSSAPTPEPKVPSPEPLKDGSTTAE